MYTVIVFHPLDPISGGIAFVLFMLFGGFWLFVQMLVQFLRLAVWIFRGVNAVRRYGRYARHWKYSYTADAWVEKRPLYLETGYLGWDQRQRRFGR